LGGENSRWVRQTGQLKYPPFVGKSAYRTLLADERA
jgi:hypothetical protein